MAIAPASRSARPSRRGRIDLPANPRAQLLVDELAALIADEVVDALAHVAEEAQQRTIVKPLIGNLSGVAARMVTFAVVEKVRAKSRAHNALLESAAGIPTPTRSLVGVPASRRAV